MESNINEFDETYNKGQKTRNFETDRFRTFDTRPQIIDSDIWFHRFLNEIKGKDERENNKP